MTVKHLFLSTGSRAQFYLTVLIILIYLPKYANPFLVKQTALHLDFNCGAGKEAAVRHCSLQNWGDSCEAGTSRPPSRLGGSVLCTCAERGMGPQPPQWPLSPRDGPDQNAPQLGVFSGNTALETAYSSTNQVLLRFHSDFSNGGFFVLNFHGQFIS